MSWTRLSGFVLGLAIPSPSASTRGRNSSQRILDLWAYVKGVELDFSRPGKPTDNAFIESLNGTFRAEYLNAHWFMNLADAQAKMRVLEGRLQQPAGHTARLATTFRQR